MRTYIVINGEEVTNPLLKFLLLVVMLLTSFVATILTVFFFLPLLGIVITLSLGVVISLVFAVFISLPMMVLMFSLLDRIFGKAEFRIRKQL